MRDILVVTALASFLAAGVAAGADLLRDVDEAYAVRELRRTPFDPRAALSFESDEARFLEELFGLTDEAVLLNTNVGRWLSTQGARGLHAVDYLERIDAVRARVIALETPGRVASVRALVSESLRLQRHFVAEWSEALEEGREFESQLTDEYAYHEGLHRSQRLLLEAHGELRGLFPHADEASYTAFRAHLRALSFE